MASTNESQIPVGTQFSPALVDLRGVIQAILSHEGKPEAIVQAMIAPPIRIKPYASPPSRRMKQLPYEAAVQYGLVTSAGEATDLTRSLKDLEGDDLYAAFARHILIHLGGLRVVQAVQEMQVEDRPITGDTLARYLTEQGFRVAEHNTAVNTLRMWLAKAGLFGSKGRREWAVSLAVKQQLLGFNDATISALVGLSPEQIAFAKALASVNPTGWIQASVIRDLAETRDGIRIGRGSLPNEVLTPLRDIGLLEFDSRGTQGGKSSRLNTTAAFQASVLEPFLEHAIVSLDPALTAYYRERPADIYADLDSSDKNIKGRALEAYSVMVMRLLGLRFVGWRRRAAETGFSEVDVLMSGLFGAVPTMWQIQCKNTPAGQVRLEQVAKEVGLNSLTRATHILVIANAAFTADAKRYADAVMQRSPLTIFLLGREDFDQIKQDRAALGRILRIEAERIQDLKMSTPVWREGDARGGSSSASVTPPQATP